MRIKAVFRFKPFSRKQRKVLNWWCRSSPVRDYNGIIADGAIRSGKSVAMSLSFVVWAMSEFESCNFAMCGGVLKCYLSGGKPRVDYITADRFVPVSWDGSSVQSGILSGTYTKGRDYYHLLEFMQPGKSEFKLFKASSDAELGRECPLAEMFPELRNPVVYEGGKPVFAYFRPFVSNN